MASAFTLQSGALPSTTQLLGFHGKEGLSRIYVYEMYLELPGDEEINLDAAVGSPASIHLSADGVPPTIIASGIFASVEIVDTFAERTVLRAALVPKLFLLTLSLHSRIFTKQAIPDILQSVLAKGGVTRTSFQLTGSYSTEEHVCQYRESDFAFVSRWMEREGIYYYFEFDDGGETLVVTDDASSHHPLGSGICHYRSRSIDTMFGNDQLRTFTCRHAVVPSSVRLKDYDYAKPVLDVTGQATVAPNGFGEVSVFGARFFSSDQGSRLARVKAESIAAARVVYGGSGAALGLKPGFTFELEDHPRADFNANYLTTEYDIWVNQVPGRPEIRRFLPEEDLCRAEIAAIPKSVQYRAPQLTSWPRIYGTEQAVVDGPSSSEYAQIDDQGRYAVKFHFDESDLSGGRASTWVRMLQPHGGNPEGFHFPLRVGTEVMCSFAGGDPDRPSIVGVAPNAITPSPITSGNHTRNVLQTGGLNRLEMEDQSGIQRMHMSTPTMNTYFGMGAPTNGHHVHLSTDGMSRFNTGQSHEYNVGTWRKETVGAYHDTSVGAYHSLKVGDYKTEDVSSYVAHTYQGPFSTKVTKDVTNTFHAKLSEHVTDHVEENYDATHSTTVTGRRAETFGTHDFLVKGVATANYQDDFTGHIKGQAKHTTSGPATLLYEQQVEQTTKGDSNEFFEKSKFEKVLGNKGSFAVGYYETIVLGGKSDLIFPLKFDLIGGLKGEVILGMKFEYVPLVALKIAGTECKTWTEFRAYLSPVRAEVNEVAAEVHEMHVIAAPAAFDLNDVHIEGAELDITF